MLIEPCATVVCRRLALCLEWTPLADEYQADSPHLSTLWIIRNVSLAEATAATYIEGKDLIANTRPASDTQGSSTLVRRLHFRFIRHVGSRV